jgi:acyl-coenzyme A thioesterase PaaI-like protein
LNSILEKIPTLLPTSLTETLKMRALGFFKIPLIFFVSPTVIELTDEKCVVKIGLNYRTKNHLGSMYFGTLATGADVAGGLIAWRLISQSGNKLNLVFKEFHADFLKRPEADVLFTCVDGPEIHKLVERALATGERENLPVTILATCPSKLGEEPVARFTLTLSLKKKKSR